MNRQFTTHTRSLELLTKQTSKQPGHWLSLDLTSVFPFFVYIQNDERKNGSLTSVFRFGLLYLPKKKLSFDFLVNLGHLGVFHGQKQLFTVQKCENVEKDMLESKTV